jgi:deoxyribodipyrimidine photo-lyase
VTAGAGTLSDLYAVLASGSVTDAARGTHARAGSNQPADQWPVSDDLEQWGLLPTRPDWAPGFRAEWTPGEAGAQERLEIFAAL